MSNGEVNVKTATNSIFLVITYRICSLQQFTVQLDVLETGCSPENTEHGKWHLTQWEADAIQANC